MSNATEDSRQGLLSFPEVVNEYAARTVATGVVVMSATYVVTRWGWVLVLLAYGFLARVASGPRFSPLALLATRVIVPRLPFSQRLTPGRPKRFAQGIGATLSLSAVIARVGFDAVGVSQTLVGMICAAATLEASIGYCLGCTIFGALVRRGVIPESACEDCADISRRSVAA
ncbi:MAG: DUF4395 domain-containing protein [Microthrixaceae bacterium]|nr:DUF4395 domain-containing protein [Microthrixaceae bacterium]